MEREYVLTVKELLLGVRQEFQYKEKQKLKKEFNKVERSYIPVNSILRIDEVNETGEAKIKENKGQISPLPINIQPPKKS